MKSGGPLAAVNLFLAAVNLFGAAEKRSFFEVLGAGKRNSDFCHFLSENHDFQ